MAADAVEDWSLDDWLWNDSELVAQPVGAALAAPPQGPAATRKGMPRKPRRLLAHAARLVCQVRSCSAALDALRPYNQRTRLCPAHMRAEAVVTDDGLTRRFCQKCNRLQPLEEFEGRRHTCASALARHNERRREAKAARAMASGCSGDSSGEARSTPGTTEGSGLSDVGAWLAELEAPNTSAAVAAHGGSGLFVLEPNQRRSALNDDPEALSAAAAAASAAASLHGYTLHFKLPALPSPAQLPGAKLRIIADEELFFGAATPASCSIRPGCVLLTFDALVGAPAACADAGAAAVALREAFSSSAAAARHAAGATVLCRGVAAALLADDAPPAAVANAPRAPAMRPAAALVGRQGGAVTLVPFELRDAEPSCTLHARLAGQAMRCEALPGASRFRVHVSAAASSPEGAALFELQRNEKGDVARAGHSAAWPALSPSRCALLCSDPAVVAEVNASADALLRTGSADADAQLQRVLLVLGAALRPNAPRRVLVAAVSACVWLQWEAALTRLLYTPAGGGGGGSALADDAGAMLLAAAAHAAAAGKGGAAAVAAAAGTLWSEEELRRAAALLRHASEADGHTRPACAVEAALEAQPDAGTAAVLRSVLSLLDATPEDDNSSSPGVAVAPAEPDAGARSFNEYCAYRSAMHWQVVYSLTLLASFVKLWLIVNFVLLRAAPPDVSAASIGVLNAALLSRVRLHPLGGGEAFVPSQLPWPLLVHYARFYVAATVALRIPVFIVAVHAATRIRRGHARSRHYARVFYFCQAFDSAFNLGLEALILYATRATVEWPALLCMLQAAGCAIGMRNAAFPLWHMYGLIAHRAASTFALVLLTQQWRLFVRNPGYAALALVFATSAALAPRREAAARDAEARQQLIGAGGGESKKEL